jgi:glycosyltransferase involved in cell wall biosynthesis
MTSRADGREDRDETTPVLSLIVPAYNEAATLPRVLERLGRLEVAHEIVVVDDGSGDGTAEVMQAFDGRDGVRLIRHPVNRGKGAGLRTGFAAATGDILVVQDADMEYDPADIPALIQPILDGHADVVYGSRLRGGRPQRAFLFTHLVGNRVLTLVTNILFNTTISDMETGYKAMRRDVVAGMTLRSDDFTIEPELTAKILKGGWRIYEVPIAYYGRTYAEGKKISWRHGVTALIALFRYRFRD